MKRYAGVGVVAAAAIALIFHPSHAQRGLVQSDPTPMMFPHRLRHWAPPQIIVYVAGAVVRPGLYHLAAGSRGVDAIRAAGGLNAQADRTGVNLAEQLEDGQQITAPLVGERIFARSTRKRRGKHKRHKRAAGMLPGVAPVDLNSVDAATLAQLPGIGDELAQRIVAFRDANGPFVSLDELADVAGMTPRLIDALAPYLTIGR